MKAITTILLTFLVMTASCQDQCNYSQEYLDSILLFQIQSCDAELLDYRLTCQEIMIDYENDLDGKDIIIDSLNVIINNFKTVLNSPIYGNIADTMRYELRGINDNTLTIIDKKGSLINVLITNNE